MGLEQIEGMKRLVYDIEVSPALGFFYPPFYKTHILKMEQPQILMSISWGWVGEYETTKSGRIKKDKDGNKVPKIYNAKLNDFAARYKKDKLDDYDLTKILHRIQNEADVVIGFNNRRFDDKMANYYYIKHNLPPVRPFKTVDLFSVAKGYFKNPANGLDFISKQMGYEGKTEVKVGQLWYDCLINGDVKSWDLMKEYNNGDIIATLQVYEKYLPFIRNAPNAGLYSGKQGVCAKCGKPGTLQSRGTKQRVSGPVRWYWCNLAKGGCGGWSSQRLVDPEDRIEPEDRHDIVNAT